MVPSACNLVTDVIYFNYLIVIRCLGTPLLGELSVYRYIKLNDIELPICRISFHKYSVTSSV